MPVRHNSAEAVIFLTIAVFSTISSSAATYYICKHGNLQSITSRLLICLHCSLLLEEISSMPYAYSDNVGLCKFMGFVHINSGLTNVVTMGLLTLFYVNYIYFNSEYITIFIQRYKHIAMFAFPLITLLPFTTDSYGVSATSWCSLPSSDETANVWAIMVFYLWVWIVIFGTVILVTYVIWKARSLDNNTATKVFSSIGIYVCVTTLCWLPRTVPRIIHLIFPDTRKTTSEEYFWTTIPLYLTGLIYSIILFMDRNIVKMMEEINGDDFSSGLQFSWEDLELNEGRSSVNMTNRSFSRSEGIGTGAGFGKSITSMFSSSRITTVKPPSTDQPPQSATKPAASEQASSAPTTSSEAVGSEQPANPLHASH